MSSRPDGSKERSRGRTKMKAAATVAGTAAGLAKRRKAPPPKSSNRTKLIILAAGILTFIAGLVVLIMVFMNSDQFDVSQEQFSGDIQLEENDNGFITWSDEYNDVNSPQSKALADDLKSKLSSALEAEGVYTDNIDIVSLSKVPLTTVTKHVKANETNPISGRTEETRTYSVNYVKAKYKTFGKPAKNAATFGSADSGSWDNVWKIVKLRIAGTGLKTSIEPVNPNPSFTDAVSQGISDHAYEISVPTPTKQKSELCDCEETGSGLSQLLPSKICSCTSGCLDEDRTIKGGIENIFHVSTPICAAAFYAEIITLSGGLVDILYSGKGTVGKAPDKSIEQFKMEKGPAYEDDIMTLKTVGGVIKPTPPSTTADPKIFGHFKVKPITPNPYVDYDELNEEKSLHAIENPPLLVHVLVNTLDGNPITYKDIFVNPSVDEMKAITDKLETMVSLDSIGMQEMSVNVLRFLEKRGDNGLIVVFSITSPVEDMVQAVTAIEKQGQSIFSALSNVMSSFGSLRSMRFNDAVYKGLDNVNRSTRKRRSARKRLQKRMKKRGNLVGVIKRML
ncbi:uncharacterized protein LOC143462050 isoform X2 [Clavelina lepadiformis]|uniref:uncharacterized protein LOC143462050 isoform X2 n=1 Tax=Clavelina lepadiformis TaxID=159417 RepID=UPI0040410776